MSMRMHPSITTDLTSASLFRQISRILRTIVHTFSRDPFRNYLFYLLVSSKTHTYSSISVSRTSTLLAHVVERIGSPDAAKLGGAWMGGEHALIVVTTKMLLQVATFRTPTIR